MPSGSGLHPARRAVGGCFAAPAAAAFAGGSRVGADVKKRCPFSAPIFLFGATLESWILGKTWGKSDTARLFLHVEFLPLCSRKPAFCFCRISLAQHPGPPSPSRWGFGPRRTWRRAAWRCVPALRKPRVRKVAATISEVHSNPER